VKTQLGGLAVGALGEEAALSGLMCCWVLPGISVVDNFLLCRVGEGRACWSLGNAYVSLGSHEQALHFARKHLEISQEVREARSEQRQSAVPVERKSLFYANKLF